MGSFESDLRILETELGVVAKAFGELTDEQWRAPTLLTPLDEKLPHWTVFELAGHFDISIGLTRMLVADNTAGQVTVPRNEFVQDDILLTDIGKNGRLGGIGVIQQQLIVPDQHRPARLTTTRAHPFEQLAIQFAAQFETANETSNRLGSFEESLGGGRIEAAARMLPDFAGVDEFLEGAKRRRVRQSKPLA